MKIISLILALLPGFVKGQDIIVLDAALTAGTVQAHGECGSLKYAVHWEDVFSAGFISRVEISTATGKLLQRREVDNSLDSGNCGHDRVRGVKTLALNFASGGSGIGIDQIIYRVRPFRHLLTISLRTHSDYFPPVEYADIDHDGQNEVIVADDLLSYALCSSCAYDADPVEYLLCYSDGAYHECAMEHPDHFRALMEEGFRQLQKPHEKKHRLAWSLYILFHAEQIGEGDAAWRRLEAALPADFLEKVRVRRPRIARALAERDKSWHSGGS